MSLRASRAEDEPPNAQRTLLLFQLWWKRSDELRSAKSSIIYRGSFSPLFFFSIAFPIDLFSSSFPVRLFACFSYFPAAFFFFLNIFFCEVVDSSSTGGIHFSLVGGEEEEGKSWPSSHRQSVSLSRPADTSGEESQIIWGRLREELYLDDED